MILDSNPQSFLKELVRDFRLKGFSRGENLRRQIKQADEILFNVDFSDVITIEV